MKKLISVFLVLALAACFSVTAFAASTVPTALTASGTTSEVAVTGSFAAGSGVTAAAVELLDRNSIIAFKTFAVADNAFSGTISVTLTAGATYTLRAANYDGGEWKTVTFTVPGAAVIPPEPEGVVPTESGAGSVKLGATVSNGTAAITATGSQIKQLITASGVTGNVTVDLSSLDASSAALPADLITAAQSDSSVTGLTLKFKNSVLTLDKASVGALPTSGGSVTMTVTTNLTLTSAQKALLGNQISNAVIADFTVTSGGTKVSSLGGRAAISLKIDPSKVSDPDSLKVWCIDNPAKIEIMGGARYDAAAGIVSFETSHNSAYAVVRFPFTDVSADCWAYSSVAYSYMNSLFTGTSNTTFEPHLAMTRGMLVTVLWRMNGAPAQNVSANPFSDVPEGQWYTDAIIWAYSNHIVNGMGGGLFAPNENVSREQVAMILYNYSVWKGYDVSARSQTISAYPDYGSISSWALTAVSWANSEKLINGADENGVTLIMPVDSATREQVATILMNFLEQHD